jgi:soluble lytic murein transglycosylase
MLTLLIIGIVVTFVYKKGNILNNREIIVHYLTPVEMYSRVNTIPMSLVFAIIRTESSGNFLAKGPTHDVGLMQITQPALTDFNKRTGKTYSLNDILNDPIKNIEVGTSHLGMLYRLFGDLHLAVQAYNVGQGTVAKDMSAGNTYADKVFSYKKQFDEELTV